MRTVEDQLQRILAPATALEPLDIPLQDARGCVLAADINAALPIPAVNTAVIDGYAAKADDINEARPGTPVVLGVTDEKPPGYQSTTRVKKGHAVRVAAGAPMPEGSDLVIPFSDAKASSNAKGTPGIAVSTRLKAGSGVRRQGAEIQAGRQVLAQGVEIGEREMAAVVAAGLPRLTVFPNPRVVIVTVGNDLVAIGSNLEQGSNYDINAASLVAAATAAGAKAFRGGPAMEDPGSIREVIEDQLVRADLIVITGGLQSVGDSVGGPVFDALRELGAVDYSATAVEPGPIIGFGTLGPQSVPVLTIPGDPAAAMIAFEIFARPLIRLMSGRSTLFRPVVRATLTRTITAADGVRRFVPAVLELRGTNVEIEPLAPSQAHSAVWLRNANALAIVPEENATMGAGDQIAAIRLDRG